MDDPRRSTSRSAAGASPSPLVYTPHPRYWAMKLIRLLTKSCAANDVGPVGFALLTVIATTEDAAWYRRAVTYFDGQLAPLIGVASLKSLAAARKKCVDAGWLHYEPGGKGRAARYWCLVPQNADGMDDHPTDEGGEDAEQMQRKFYVESGDESGTQRESNGDDPTCQRANILPIPSSSEPIPKSRRKNGTGLLKKVDEKTLSNISELMAWLATSTEPDLCYDDFETRLAVTGVWVRVKTNRRVKKSIGCFVALVRDRDWSKISDNERTEAKRRYSAWDNASRSNATSSETTSIQLAESIRSGSEDERRESADAKKAAGRKGIEKYLPQPEKVRA